MMFRITITFGNPSLGRLTIQVAGCPRNRINFSVPALNRMTGLGRPG
jgi:hypothetical protein